MALMAIWRSTARLCGPCPIRVLSRSSFITTSSRQCPPRRIFHAPVLAHYQASQLLGLSRFEFDGFLKKRHIYDHAYDVEDFEQDSETLRHLQAKGLVPE